MTDDSIADLLGGKDANESENYAATIMNAPTQVPSVFADGCLFAVGMGQNVRLQLVEYLPNAADSADPGIKTRHVINLIMPVDGFQATLAYLNGVNEKFFVSPEDAE